MVSSLQQSLDFLIQQTTPHDFSNTSFSVFLEYKLFRICLSIVWEFVVDDFLCLIIFLSLSFLSQNIASWTLTLIIFVTYFQASA